MGDNTGKTLLTLMKLNSKIKLDNEDLNRFLFKKVYFTNGYLALTVNNKPEYLHRLILGAKRGEVVDHKDPNKVLDCRRSNLRLCTQRQNCYNTTKRVDNTSGYKGVSYDKERNKWEAYIHLPSVVSNKSYKKHLGRYATAEQAAEAYKIAAKKYYGEYANLG